MQHKWFPFLLSYNLILKLDEIKQRESRQRKQCISICYEFPYLRLDSFLIKIRTQFFPRLFSGTVLMFFMCILLFISYNILSNYTTLKGCLFFHRQTALVARNYKIKNAVCFNGRIIMKARKVPGTSVSHLRRQRGKLRFFGAIGLKLLI